MVYYYIEKQMKRSLHILCAKRQRKMRKRLVRKPFLGRTQEAIVKRQKLCLFSSLYAPTLVDGICSNFLFSPHHRKMVCSKCPIGHFCHNWNIGHFCHSWNITKNAKFSVTTGTSATSVTTGISVTSVTTGISVTTRGQ